MAKMSPILYLGDDLTSKMHLSPSMALAAVLSVLLLLIHCLLLFPLFVGVLCLVLVL